MWRLLILPLVAVLMALFASPARAWDDVLPPAVRRALVAAGVPADALAAVALPLDHWSRPWRYRDQVAMQPGSSMKVVTSVVALDRLGPNHRGYTELRSAAAVEAGVLQGDLVLKGGADPDLDVAQFWAMLMELRQRGVSTLAGDLIVDRTLFRPARIDQGLLPFDETPEFDYNVIPDALMLAGNLLPLEIRSDSAGVHVGVLPALEGLVITSRMALSARACKDWDEDWRPATVHQAGGRTTIELQGGFPANCTQRAGMQLIDRLELAERLFRTLWQGLGGRWTGSAREAAAPEGTRLLVRRTSRAWGEVLRPMLKTSDNALTRLLYLQLGVPAMSAEPGATTTELAAREVRRWFAEHGIDDQGLVLDNGSGLSRSERITPRQLATLLAVAWRGPNASDLMMGLPVAGVDGTMRNRLKDSPATGWARLKTGTLRNVVALAGYIRDERGRQWAVAMMINHDNANRARPVLDALIDSFSRFGPHGSVAGDSNGN